MRRRPVDQHAHRCDPPQHPAVDRLGLRVPDEVEVATEADMPRPRMPTGEIIRVAIFTPHIIVTQVVLRHAFGFITRSEHPVHTLVHTLDHSRRVPASPWLSR